MVQKQKDKLKKKKKIFRRLGQNKETPNCGYIGRGLTN